MKTIFLVLAILTLISLLGVHLAKAQDSPPEQPVIVKESKPQGAGNKICPVSGEKIDEKTKATYEYEGKIYNFCCPVCVEEFKKDPQKYIKKVEEELLKNKEEESQKPEPDAQTQATKMEHERHHKH